MAMSYQNADAKLNADLRGGATPHLWLHTGDPGAAGPGNVAQVSSADIARKALTFGDAPANHPSNTERRVLNTADAEWTGAQVDASQEIQYFSIWSALTAGTLLYLAAVGTAKTTGSDGVTVPTGDLEVAIGVYVKPA